MHYKRGYGKNTSDGEEHHKWMLKLLQDRYNVKFKNEEGWREYLRDYKYYLIKYWRNKC